MYALTLVIACASCLPDDRNVPLKTTLNILNIYESIKNYSLSSYHIIISKFLEWIPLGIQKGQDKKKKSLGLSLSNHKN